MTERKTAVVQAAGPAATRAKRDCWRWLEWWCRILDVLDGREDGGDPCVTVPGRVISKPDPCLYSQFLLLQLEQPVTWDNPDVRILRNGQEQDTYNLLADTTYDIEVTVHNSSRTKPALGTTVRIVWIEFGAGGKVHHHITTVATDVPVWPGTTIVPTTWRTPANPGHYCLEVVLDHPDDGNPANNRGWNNTQVHAANSPVERDIRIFNQFPGGCPPIKEGGGRAIKISRLLLGWALLGGIGGGLTAMVDQDADKTVGRLALFAAAGYAALGLLGLLAEWLARRHRHRKHERERKPHDRVPCEYVELTVDSYTFVDTAGKDFDPEAAFAPRPPDWPARLDPSTFKFNPGEPFRDVALHVDAPDGPGPAANFNVNATQGGFASGGVTLTITRGGV